MPHEVIPFKPPEILFAGERQVPGQHVAGVLKLSSLPKLGGLTNIIDIQQPSRRQLASREFCCSKFRFRFFRFGDLGLRDGEFSFGLGLPDR